MIQTILEKVFGRKINVRMREGFSHLLNQVMK